MPAKYTVVAPVGEDLDALYVGIREFPTEKVILLRRGGRDLEIQEVKRNLEKFKIPVHVMEVRGELMEGMFKAFAQLKESEGEDNILVNVATGDKLSTCAALSAAFVNGLKAFGVVNDKPIIFPVLKFSYYKILSERKIKILKTLNTMGSSSSLEELSERTKMSVPLISYHINGNPKSKGLVQLGLVETVEGTQGRTGVRLTELGRLLADGYITPEYPPSLMP